MTRRDYILNHFATKFAADNQQANPVAAAAVGTGTLSALVAAVLSKKGKRLRNAGIAGVAGAAVGAGGGAAIGAQLKKRVQQAAQYAAQQKELNRLEEQFSPESQRAYSRQPTLAGNRERNRLLREKAAQQAAQEAAQFEGQPKAPYSAIQDALRELQLSPKAQGAKTTTMSDSQRKQIALDAGILAMSSQPFYGPWLDDLPSMNK